MVNVSLEVPADYQAREFVSVADSVHRPSMLSLVVQRRGQIAAIRLVAALVVILLVWRMSSASLFGKLTLSLCIFLVAVGFETHIHRQSRVPFLRLCQLSSQFLDSAIDHA